MGIATRLLAVLVPSMVVIMGVYAFIALHQRAELISEALIRETETLAQALRAVTDNAIRDGRYPDLDAVLSGVSEDPETFLVAVLEPSGEMLSGGTQVLPDCLPTGVIQAPPESGLRGWAECEGRVRWVSLPVREPARALLVARRATVVEQDEAHSRIRISLTTLALGGGAALVILLVLQSTLSRPLERILAGVRELGGPSTLEPIRLGRSAGELRYLAEAFNEMAKRLEEKRRTLVKEVEGRIALEGRVRREEKFAALGRLTGGLAHELGTPLNVIGVRAEAILESQETSEDARRQAREIVAEVERVAGLIRSLVHMARRDRLDPEPVDLAELVREVAPERLPGDIGGPTRPRLRLPPDPVIVEGDRNLLRHALLNLVTNAVQALASEEGERDEPGALDIILDLEGGWATVEILDDGPGVPPTDVPHLFEPFFTTKDVGEGMGLGLAIARGIIEEHGGSLELEVQEPRGVRAVVRLPQEPSALPGAGEEGASQ
ncbi:MAG: sensor histidine kinase [Gemmatimonadales bacterium]|nr:MAG: sensor histidine kinase [Gemmatimonadales bacterium]